VCIPTQQNQTVVDNQKPPKIIQHVNIHHQDSSPLVTMNATTTTPMDTNTLSLLRLIALDSSTFAATDGVSASSLFVFLGLDNVGASAGDLVLALP
jgi:hypothetical protein